MATAPVDIMPLAGMSYKDQKPSEEELEKASSEKIDTRTKDGFEFTHFEHYSADETAQLSKKLVRKVDFRVMPVLVLLFILNILDRGNIANANTAGMAKDLHLKGYDYNNLVLIMFVGYVVTQVPSGLVLSKVKPARFLAVAVFCWGVVSMCCGFVHSWGVMMVVRFLVGVCEAPFFPGALLIISSFYRKSEIPTRIAVMYSGNSLSNGFGGLLAAGIVSGLDGKAGLKGWRWLLILEGVLTIAVAGLCLFILPSWPSDTKWLSEEERRLAVWRAKADAEGVTDEGGNESLWTGAKLVLRDWRVFAIVLQQNLISCTGSFSYFFPAIVKGLGYSTNITLLLTAPPFFFAFALSVLVAWSSSRFNERAMHIALPSVLGVIGNIMLVTIPLHNIGGRYVSMFLLSLSGYCTFNISYSWLIATVPRPRIKRAASLSLVSGLANASHFYTPYIFPSSDGPRYLGGGIALAVFNAGVLLIAVTLKFAFAAQNRKLQKYDDEGKPYPGALSDLPPGYRFSS